ncbi:MAG: hypothetical protein KDK97_13645 [Verrucomicrobiales bacterium]|nr:hypothetical protein [Verrucomicrobiales bacterium]MCP5556672.1 hypothetical protein [Verrucomicrobiaceae bacterium]
MKRRRLLATLATLPATSSLMASTGRELDNPYAEVKWDAWECLQSMSHQHQGQTDASRDGFVDMGYGHLAFSNYYPSAPTYPLPKDYAAKHPQLIAAPNAEHHSFTDTGLHANALGSLLATGYGSSVSAKECATAPIAHGFDGLDVFDAQRPWLGVYRLDVRLAAKAGKPTASLTLEGANECDFRNGFADKGPVRDRNLPPGNHTLYLRTTASCLETKLVFDADAMSVTQYRLMQGTNRPWRDVFREAFAMLQYLDGGGMTLNHPTGKLADYLPMLDFDPRVLGIEVWNQLTSGFGSSRGFYDHSGEPSLHFYQLWDDILRTGRRCWGFFVKDHNTYGRGRNVLLVPKLDAMTTTEREAAALRAYRRGTFFGSVASLAASETGEVIAPYDRSSFRFNRIAVQNDTLHVTVSGNDPKRPNVQIRFITDQGIASIVDAAKAAFPLKRDSAGRLEAAFVRVEAFAYPKTHQRGQPLTAAMLRQMHVHDISLLHDQKALRGPAFASTDPALRTPIPIVDMIFSQPLRRV